MWTTTEDQHLQLMVMLHSRHTGTNVRDTRKHQSTEGTWKAETLLFLKKDGYTAIQ